MERNKPTILERLKAIDVAEDCFELADGDVEVAKELFTKIAPSRGIDPALVAVLLQLLVPILLKWLEKRTQKNAEA
jgi:hypothetical protein